MISSTDIYCFSAITFYKFATTVALIFMCFTAVLSKLQMPRPTINLTLSSRGTYEPLLVDWRSKALEKYSAPENSTLKRRECWIMKMGPENDYREDEVICTDKKAPTLTQLIAHGRNGTEYGRADAAHIPVFYTDWKNAALGAAGGLAGTNPSEKILWYIDRSFKGYQSDKSACQGGLVLNKQVYTYSNMVRDSWFVRTDRNQTSSSFADLTADRTNVRARESSGRLSAVCLS